MRLEQRIGRIDRIGQQEPFIRIVHLFYRDTVEYDAYTAMEERIREFQENVGTLQPILAANLESLIRESVMDGGASRDVKQAVRNLDSLVKSLCRSNENKCTYDWVQYIVSVPYTTPTYGSAQMC